MLKDQSEDEAGFISDLNKDEKCEKDVILCWLAWGDEAFPFHGPSYIYMKPPHIYIYGGANHVKCDHLSGLYPYFFNHPGQIHQVSDVVYHI